MTPSWYDVLDVDPSAAESEIRAAWKSAIAELEPGDRRFRLLNQAAEALLDPARRAQHDAALAADAEAEDQAEDQAEDEPQPAPVATPEPVVLTKTAPAPADVAEPGGEPDSEPDAAFEPTLPTAGASPAASDEEPAGAARTVVPLWLLAALAALVIAVVAGSVHLSTKPSDDAVATATTQALSAAERAAPAVLSYDYRDLDANASAAHAMMTKTYRDESYDPLFKIIKSNAPGLKTIVSVDKIVASGIVRSGDDRVQVLVFLNRTTSNASGQQALTQDQVVMTMQRGDDGEWLVSDMNTNELG